MEADISEVGAKKWGLLSQKIPFLPYGQKKGIQLNSAECLDFKPFLAVLEI
jgi:hypothetical protein